jgi:uncharacterized protein (UPF0333 family)
MLKFRRFAGRKFMAGLLAFLLVFSNVGNVFMSSEVRAEQSDISLTNGIIQKQSTVNIAPGVQQTKLQVSTEKGPLKIYNMNIDPANQYVKFEAGMPNGKLAGFQTVRKQAELISRPGYEVVGGINADFYNTSNGIPIEAVVHDGKVIRSNGNRSIVGILKSGEVKIGQLRMQIEMEVTPQTKPEVQVVPEPQQVDENDNNENAALNVSGEMNEGQSAQSTGESRQSVSEAELKEESQSATENIPPIGGEESASEPQSTGEPQSGTAQESQQEDNAKSVENIDGSAVEEATKEAAPNNIAPQTFTINGINRERGANSIILFTPDYDVSTFTNQNGTEVILEGISGFLKTQGEVTATVKEILKDKGNTKLSEGQMVLSGEGNGKAVLEQLAPGDKITVRTTVNAPWDQLEEAVGGYHLLVQNGQPIVFSDPYSHPRTAVGIKADGSVFFTVIDGRQPGVSEGVTLTELGQIMKDMGAVEAINLDGGGSSTFVARQPGDSNLSVVNIPSDGGERNVANSLLVVSTAPKGELSHLTVLPEETVIFTGSHTTFQVKGQDQYYHPSEITGNVTWSVDQGLGQFDQNGVFTAGSTTASGKVTASVNNIQASANVKVVDKLDSISIYPTQLALGQGETAKIRAAGYINGMPVIVDEDAFSYSVEGNIGTIDEKGNFQATSDIASGKIKVSIGELVEEIKVDVGKPPIILEDFEDGITGWNKSGARFNSVNISAASEPEPVRFGEKSLRIDYDFIGQKGTSGAYAWPVEDIVLEGYPDKIGMWFYGANDGHWIRAQMRDGNGAAFPIDFTDQTTGVDWEGWKYIEAEIPKGKTTPLKLDLAVRIMQTSDAKKNAATVYVDNIRAVYGKTNDDLINPTLTDAFPANGSTTPAYQPTISVIAKDNEGGTGIDPSKIKMKLDGNIVPHTYDESTGKISYQPDSFLSGGYHTVSVLVKDGFENPAELTWSFFISAGSQFLIEGPKQVYAGDEFDIHLKIKGLKELSKAEAKLKFDPNVIQVIDQDAENEGVQLKVGKNLKSENVGLLSVNNEKGEISLKTEKLEENTGLQATDTLVTVPFKVSKTAVEDIKIELQDGEFTYIRGDVKKSFHQPYEANIQHKYSLDISGVSVGSVSKLKVMDESGKPVKDADINLLAPETLTKYAKVTTDSAKVYKSADQSSVVLSELVKDQKVFVSSESAEYTEIYVSNGQKGYVLKDQLELYDLPKPLGSTDEKGEFSTDLLTLAEITFALQAEKDGQVSQVKEFTVVPQIGGKTPEHVKLSWKLNPKTTQSITWRTNPGVTGTVVQYVPTDKFTDFNADNVMEGEGTSSLLTDKAGEMRIHEVTLDKLIPNTSYTYRVGDGTEEGWSQAYTFRTEPKNAEPFTFLFTTDSQASDLNGNKIYGNILTKALETYPDARFLLHGGDIVDDGAKMDQWENFFDVIEGVTPKLSLHAVLGNHDVYGDGEYLFQSFFQNPENGPEGEKEWVYSFDYGDVHFAMLNSESGSDSMKAQAEWLRQDMKNSNKPWKVVMFHRAPYHSNPLRGVDATQSIFAPVVEELDIDLAIVGHDHAYARTFPMKGGVAAEQGKGTVYVIGGSSGPKFYPEEKYDYLEFLYGEDKQVFTAVHVENDKLVVEARTIDGEVIDTFELPKKDRKATSNDKIYNLVGFSTKKLTIQTANSLVNMDGTSSIKEGIWLKNSATLKGEGLKNTKIVISPTSKDAVIDLSGAEVKEVIIDNANVKEIRGAENVQIWTITDGVDTSNIIFKDSKGEVMASPFFVVSIRKMNLSLSVSYWACTNSFINQTFD